MKNKEIFESSFNEKVLSEDKLKEYKSTSISKNNPKFDELIHWLEGNKYCIPLNTSESFKCTHQWELSRNYIIDKTIKKIKELLSNSSPVMTPLDCFESFGADLDGCSRASNQGCAGCAHLDMGVKK